MLDIQRVVIIKERLFKDIDNIPENKTKTIGDYIEDISII